MKIVSTALICISLMLLTACNIFTPSPTPPETRIGVLIPLSGKRAISGRKALAGIFLAHDQINKRGPVRGKMIKLVIIDNKSTFKGSRRAMERFIKKENITLLIVTCPTDNALAIKSMAAAAKLPVLLTVATGNIATERNPYMFRSCFNDSFQGKAMAIFAYKNKMYNNVDVLLDMNDRVTYPRDLGRAFAATLKKLSGRTVTKIAYHSGSNNLVLPMKKMKKNDTEAIFAPSNIPNAGIIINEARKNGMHKVLLGSDGWDRPELFYNCGPQPEPCFLTSMFSPEAKLAGVKEFVRLMKRRTGSIPDADSAQAYDALYIAVKALKLSRSTSDIRSGLYQIKNYPGLSGNTSINAQGNAVKSVFIKKVIKKANGKFAFKLIKIITPQEIAKEINK